MTVDEKVRFIIGDLVIQNAALEVRTATAEARVAELEPKKSPPLPL